MKTRKIVAMIMSLALITSTAMTGNPNCGLLSDNVQTVSAETFTAQDTGDFTLTADEELTSGVDYSFADGVLTILSAKPMTIANTDPNTATTNKIIVKMDISANITLAGVNIDNSAIDYESKPCAFKIEDNSRGNVTITLKDGTTNTLKSGSYYPGLQKEGNIEGIGKLEITGTGRFITNGGIYGAGIGGSHSRGTTNITISSGTITANGGDYASGIGGGSYSTGSDITISGGTITATGGLEGAGIGGGCKKGSASNITISGGTITAIGGKFGAGIGGGSRGSASNITISGGSVNAIASNYVDNGTTYTSAKIGSGIQYDDSTSTRSNGEEATLTLNSKTQVLREINFGTAMANTKIESLDIAGYGFNDMYTDSTGKLYLYVPEDITSFSITANGTIYNVNLSGEINVADGSIEITGSSTYTQSGVSYVLSADTTFTLSGTTTTNNVTVAKDISANITLAGVNIASGGCAFKIADNSTGNVTITLKDGTKNTLNSPQEYAGLEKNGDGADIGELKITGTGELIATGINGAGIGGGNLKSASNITIVGGKITASGINGGSGIGSGNYGKASNITISGGLITASADNAAGIGGGYNGNADGITISGGTITATANFNGAGIGGGGNGGSASNITISGGSVKATASSTGAKIGNSDGTEATLTLGGKKQTLKEISFGTGMANTKIESLDIVGYGFNDMYTDGEGKLYLYVPEDTTLSSITSNGTTYNVNLSGKINVADGSIEITGSNTYTQNGVSYALSAGTTFTLSGTTTNTVTVAKDISANITLAGVNIDTSATDNTYAFKIADNSTGNVTITLKDGTTNTLASGSNYAGLQKNVSDSVTNSGTLEITGTGQLTANGGNCGAAIGGGNSGSTKNITISGGTITANGNFSAGIGGGQYGNASDIIISGGTITANGGIYAAGIGGGRSGNASNIKISDGTITATGREGAGIGGGYSANADGIIISGGTITANGKNGGAGIGGGQRGSASNIKISGGSVKAVASTLYNNAGTIKYTSAKIGNGILFSAATNEASANGQEAQPTSDGTTPVYLITVPNTGFDSINPNVTVDGTNYNVPTTHTGDSNFYLYAPVKAGTNSSEITIGSGETSKTYDVITSLSLNLPTLSSNIYHYDTISNSAMTPGTVSSSGFVFNPTVNLTSTVAKYGENCNYTIDYTATKDSKSAYFSPSCIVGSTGWSLDATGKTLKYSGTIDGVQQKALTNDDISLTKIPNKEYTGSEIKPSLSITYNGIDLVEDTDYTVSYSNNKDIGTATADITFKGGFTGTASTTFKIVQTKEYTVKFKDIKGNILKTESVVSGTSATPPTAPEVDGYYFYGWDRQYNSITADTVINPIYRKITTISVGNISGHAGEIVKIPINMEQYESVNMLKLAVNANGLNIKGIEKTKDFTNLILSNNIIQYTYSANDAENGTLCYILAEIPSTATTSDTYNVELSVNYFVDANHLPETHSVCKAGVVGVEEVVTTTDVTTTTQPAETTTTTDVTTTTQPAETTTTTDVTTEQPEILDGDINCDGKININDLIMLAKYLVGTYEPTEQGLANIDITHDGKIGISDLIQLAKHLAGLLPNN